VTGSRPPPEMHELYRGQILNAPITMEKNYPNNVRSQGGANGDFPPRASNGAGFPA